MNSSAFLAGNSTFLAESCYLWGKKTVGVGKEWEKSGKRVGKEWEKSACIDKIRKILLDRARRR